MNSRYTSYMKYRDFGNKVSSIPLETRSLCPNPCKGLFSSVLEKRSGFEIVGFNFLRKIVILIPRYYRYSFSRIRKV